MADNEQLMGEVPSLSPIQLTRAHRMGEKRDDIIGNLAGGIEDRGPVVDHRLDVVADRRGRRSVGVHVTAAESIDDGFRPPSERRPLSRIDAEDLCDREGRKGKGEPLDEITFAVRAEGFRPEVVAQLSDSGLAPSNDRGEESGAQNRTMPSMVRIIGRAQHSGLLDEHTGPATVAPDRRCSENVDHIFMAPDHEERRVVFGLFVGGTTPHFAVTDRRFEVIRPRQVRVVRALAVDGSGRGRIVGAGHQMKETYRSVSFLAMPSQASPSEDIQNWISDTALSSRFPYYTRANADEVGPDPFSPLGWSLGWAKGCIPGVAGGFISFGVVEADEFAVDPPEVFGNWGGYFYNQLSLPRVMGCRMPGASPEAIDQAYFGDHPGVPPYTPHPDDENEAQTAKLEATMGWAMSTDGFPRQEETAAMARQAVADRPDFSKLSGAELVAYGRRMAGLVEDAWVPYCETCLAVSLGPGAVQAICDAVGRGDDAVKLLAAIGDVESAEASFIMWDLSRGIAGSAALTAAFDAGVDGLLDRIADDDASDVAAFRSGFAALLEQHGHRGPNEWDMRPHSWTTKPELALGMIERLRFQDDNRSPHEAKAAAATERERLSAEILGMVEGDEEAHGTLTAGLSSAALFYGLREKGKNSCIRLIHEAKLAFFELGRRLVDAGAIDDVQQVFMAVDSELETLLADPMSMRSTLIQRDADFAHLHTLEPPYIVKYEEGVPPISEWALRNSGTTEAVSAGEVLQGGAGAPGTVTGVARVVLDPSDPSAIQPGDIMVAPTTDPSWTPLFLSAAGVVVNVGAVASHAAIVCRELGVPCAVSVVDATRRIPDGATISIDGSSGTVTIIDLP